MEEIDRREGDQSDREMSMLGAGLGNVTLDGGLETGAENSADDSGLSDESQSSEDEWAPSGTDL